ncbi:phage tail protein [Paenibacillus alvei]|uniref:phage tail protein n=1 Tax=Paenibacillus alvei TaxID=44250 RepID=UPI00228304BA|nr:phage tail protein [Paenibacillus alvei]MCY7486423.1 phage tail protein [Paenibacillus alvei]
MNKIGSLGPVVFVVSPEAIRTFDEFTRSSAGRWAKHEVLGKKPLSQWIGPGLDTISFTMWFDVQRRLNPRKELDRLVELDRKGKAMPLIVGGKAVGVGLWTITSLEQSWKTIDGKGNILFATANISLEEYVK